MKMLIAAHSVILNWSLRLAGNSERGGWSRERIRGAWLEQKVIIPTRRILKWPRQTATMTLDEVTMGKGHRGHELSSTPVKQAVSLHLGLAQPQTLVPGQIGTQSPEPASTGQSFYVQVCKWLSLWSTHICCCPTSPLHWAVLWLCVCKWRIETILYRMSYSAVLFTVRSRSVFQDVGSANSMVICMFPRYILNWLSNLKPLSRTGKSCNGTCGRKSICFIVKIWCAETICINGRLSLWLVRSASHALVPLAGPGGAAPVPMRHAVH